MFWIDFISRFLHIATAITLIGGSVFTLFVLLPAVKVLSADAHAALSTGLAARWKLFVHSGILLFLVTGGYNFYRALESHRGDPVYHALLGIKILLALGVFFIASALVGRSDTFASLREKRRRWLSILLVLATAIVLISSFAKVRGPAEPIVPQMIAEQERS